jgi:hypothetical protein
MARNAWRSSGVPKSEADRLAPYQTGNVGLVDSQGKRAQGNYMDLYSVEVHLRPEHGS